MPSWTSCIYPVANDQNFVYTETFRCGVSRSVKEELQEEADTVIENVPDNQRDKEVFNVALGTHLLWKDFAVSSSALIRIENKHTHLPQRFSPLNEDGPRISEGKQNIGWL